jgi:hypothetical protein
LGKGKTVGSFLIACSARFGQLAMLKAPKGRFFVLLLAIWCVFYIPIKSAQKGRLIYEIKRPRTSR